MPQRSFAELIERRRGEVDRESSDRFVDLQLELWAEDANGERTGEHLGTIGGRWDRRLKEYVGDATTTRSIGIHPGQLDAVRWFLGWLGDYIDGREIPIDERIFSALLAGGQRSGKTWLGVLLDVVFAIAVPGSIVWVVCPSDRDFEEVEDVLRLVMPVAWFETLGAPWHRWRLINGSKIVLRSAHIPEKLKKGDADFILVNEAQQQEEKAFAICRGRIAAAGGLVLVAANPPDKPVGDWVGAFASEAQAGRRQALYFHLDPLDNPHIDTAPLLAMRKEFDEHTYDTEIRGLFLGPKNAVLYNWSRTENEIAMPLSGEITRDFLKWAEGREYDRAVGVDVQRYPHMSSVEFRFFENPAALTGRDRFEWCHTWAAAEVTLHAADEEDLAIAWLELGWEPARTLIICDASGEWQFAERDPAKLKKMRDEGKGRGSFDIFRRFGFRNIVKPDRAMEKNPDVIERCRSAAARICTKAAGPFGQRFLFSDPANRDLNTAIRSWPTKNGQPMRTSKYAHRGDAFTYPIHRLFPRRRKVDKMPEVTILERRDGQRMDGW